ncbi:MAG: glycine zipper domain-containing protein [Aliihoeflea sp.]|uniref:glycine zipper domain-containing protein n=1 Tax=unclassified Aliihoeflea TaxID=2628764 RepID=UPI00046370BA|nr:glycine zipper domain-containing protein [Aliihoeflea sp. 2WW]
MKKTLLALAATMMIAAGCTTAEQTAVGGAAVGAGVGAIATGRASGALAGAAIGGAAGYLVGRSQDRQGYCLYRDRNNPSRTYEARC